MPSFVMRDRCPAWLSFQEEVLGSRSGRRRLALAHPTIKHHLDFHASILSTPCSRRVVGYRFCFTVTHWGHNTTRRNLMIHCEILDHRFRTLLTEPEVLCLAAGRIRMPRNLDWVALGVLSFRCKLIELSLRFW